MSGMNVTTGKRLSGLDHIRQSISDILTTPQGSRVMRREYGSLVFELIDQAANATGEMLLKAVCAHAIARWEPRVRLRRVSLTGFNLSGRVLIDIDLEVRATGEALSLEGIAL